MREEEEIEQKGLCILQLKNYQPPAMKVIVYEIECASFFLQLIEH